MITKTYLSKCTTILKDSELNFGLNPVGMLHYGFSVSRLLVDFNLDKIKEKYKNKTFVDRDKVTHILKMKNCGSIDETRFYRSMPSFDERVIKKRAISFYVLLLRVPQEWHRGVGFDNSADFWFVGDSVMSDEACNWYQSYNGHAWPEEGVYTNETIAKEYIKFSNGEDSLILNRQRFEFGNEDLEMDITSYVNDVLDEKYKHYGLMLCFTPDTEILKTDYSHYVGFFTNNTNTFFEPYVETHCSEVIKDDRYNFYLGKTNKLYLYANIGGEPRNLDELPVCTINDVSYPVKQQTIGVYYVEAKFTKNDVRSNTIMYDTWSNLKYEGDEIDDVENEFVVLPTNNYFKLDGTFKNDAKYSATIVGVKDCERLIQGETRLLKVLFRENYTQGTYKTVNDCQYRIYVLDGDKEIDVIKWEDINTMYDFNFFTISTDEFLPNRYFVDIKAKMGMEERLFKKEIEFEIVSNNTNMKI